MYNVFPKNIIANVDWLLPTNYYYTRTQYADGSSMYCFGPLVVTRRGYYEIFSERITIKIHTEISDMRNSDKA